MYEIDPKMEVLVVSASRHEQFQVKMLLKQIGIGSVTMLESGIEALNLCAKKKFKLIISDLDVAYIPGWLFVKELKTSDKIPNSAVILMGKDHCPVPEAERKQFGVLSYLQPPYSAKEMMAALVQTLSHFDKTDSVENRYTDAKGALVSKNGPVALMLYSALNSETKASSRSSIGLAQSYDLTGNHEAAEDLVDKVLKNGDVGPAALMMALRSALVKKDDKEARSLARKIITATDSSEFYFQAIGDECLKYDDLWLAENVFHQALEQGHRRPLISLGLAKASYLRGHIKDALTQTRKVLLSHGEFLEALNLEGICLRRQGRHDEALLCYEKALKVSPLDAKVYFNMALCAVAMDALADAENFLTSSLQVMPGFKKASEKLQEVKALRKAAGAAARKTKGVA